MNVRKPALDPAEQEPVTGSGYPKEFRSVCDGRSKKRLGDVLGLTQFGVNLVTLAPGSASALRHWHENEDEFVYIVSGRLILITDAGEQELKPGMVAGFPAGNPDGHQLVNKSGADAVYLEIGTRAKDEVAHYPDVDLGVVKTDGAFLFHHKDGTPYNKDS